jgi:nitroimidazol reductase NimA-like FMN-containing flavoprotein (pyridoxamine 5'-phosphate oxidase superfamily)
MPGYEEMLEAHGDRGLLPWSWAVERLSSARNYWISTIRADGRPHSMPVWGVWLDVAFYFSTGALSRKARNLAENAGCVVCPERADEAVILEGTASQLTDPSMVRRVVKVYNAKYQWELDPEMGPLYEVRPQVVFAFIENEDAQEFPGSHTRWTLDQS